MLAKRPVLSRFTTAAVSTVSIIAALLVGDAGTALAATGAHFVPEATEAKWDGAVATVTFREVDVALRASHTTISVKVTVDVNEVCTRGESTLRIHRSATALAAKDYPISDDKIVSDTAQVPVAVGGLVVDGFKCVVERQSVSAALEDFWTGATLTHTA